MGKQSRTFTSQVVLRAFSQGMSRCTLVTMRALCGSPYAPCRAPLTVPAPGGHHSKSAHQISCCNELRPGSHGILALVVPPCAYTNLKSHRGKPFCCRACEQTQCIAPDAGWEKRPHTCPASGPCRQGHGDWFSMPVLNGAVHAGGLWRQVADGYCMGQVTPTQLSRRRRVNPLVPAHIASPAAPASVLCAGWHTRGRAICSAASHTTSSASLVGSGRACTVSRPHVNTAKVCQWL
jgi:hypothetical protein